MNLQGAEWSSTVSSESCQSLYPLFNSSIKSSTLLPRRVNVGSLGLLVCRERAVLRHGESFSWKLYTYKVDCCVVRTAIHRVGMYLGSGGACM